MSSAWLSTSACLYSALALASSVAMKRVPMYAKSAPIACVARIAEPLAIAPDRITVPS